MTQKSKIHRVGERQAKIESNLLFGDIDGSSTDKVTKKPQQRNKQKREGMQGSSFPTKADQVGGSESSDTKSKSDVSLNSAFTKPCMFCEEKSKD